MVFSFSKYVSEKLRPCMARLASLGIMEASWGPPCNTLDQHSTIVLRGLRGALNGPPLCRKPLASRTADVIFTLWIFGISIVIWFFWRFSLRKSKNIQCSKIISTEVFTNSSVKRYLLKKKAWKGLN